jgi:hypothetical protein
LSSFTSQDGSQMKNKIAKNEINLIKANARKTIYQIGGALR